MKRRNFLIGTGSTAIGGSVLLGSGAFSRVESQRRVKIEVAEDPDAYLGLDGCPESANNSYTNIDEESGHLEIDMSPDNPTDAGGQGVNSDSRTYFHNVFQICNQGKQEVCVWIHDDEDWPLVPEGYDDEGDRRVEFYLGDDPERSIIGSENGVRLPLGECICVGIKTNTKGLSEGDQLLEDLDDEIKIIADEECPPEVPPEELPGEIRGRKKLTDGLKDSLDEDNPKEGWIIELYQNDTLIDATETDADGHYFFDGLAPGDYTVCEVPKPGTVQIKPEDGECHEVTVEEDEVVDGIDFKNDLEDFDPEEPPEVPRTIGFWSNWSGGCTPGGQPNILGDTLQAAEDAEETITLGELPITRDAYADGDENCGAVRLLNKRDLAGNNRASDGAYALAAQLLAAKLNRQAGAEINEEGDDCEDVAEQIAAGQALLDDLEFDGTDEYLPPGPGANDRQQALDIANCLDLFNNEKLEFQQ